MRCSQCGSSIRHDPVWSNGMSFCSLECAEENRMVLDDYCTDDMHTSEIHALFGADDDDY